MWILLAIAVLLVFAVLWWLVFRGVRKYPNLHNLHDDHPEIHL